MSWFIYVHIYTYHIIIFHIICIRNVYTHTYIYISFHEIPCLQLWTAAHTYPHVPTSQGILLIKFQVQILPGVMRETPPPEKTLSSLDIPRTPLAFPGFSHWMGQVQPCRSVCSLGWIVSTPYWCDKDASSVPTTGSQGGVENKGEPCSQKWAWREGCSLGLSRTHLLGSWENHKYA